jgi:hypothetical protein
MSVRPKGGIGAAGNAMPGFGRAPWLGLTGAIVSTASFPALYNRRHAQYA